LSEVRAPRLTCTESSLESNEEMYGTAPRVDVWFVLEYPGHWTKDALEHTKIPEEVMTVIRGYLGSTPNSRLQLIKKPRKSESGITLFIALSRESEPKLFELKLDSYEDLLDIDINSILSDESFMRKDPLFLICTNGAHDGCCGKFGMPVYLDIQAGEYGPDTWETTHLGGHRFASTFVCLPHGVYYGRVREGKIANALIEEYKNGTVNLRSLRGRTCFDKDVQAAEYFLRTETEKTDLSNFRFNDKKKNKQDISVTFEDVPQNKLYEVRLRKYDSPLKIIKACGEVPSAVPRYIFLDQKIL